MKYRVKFLLTIVCFVLLVNLVSACNLVTINKEINVILVNSTDDEWHLMIGHNTSLDSGNKVAPGASMMYKALVKTNLVETERYLFNDTVKCVSGKNGNIVKTNKVTLRGDAVDTVTIVWDGSDFKIKQ